MVTEEEKVISAYNLFKSDLITIKGLTDILEMIKGGKVPTTYPTTKTTTNPNQITTGQVNYILKLKADGRIPQSQSLDLTKAEAQALIHSIVNSPEAKQENREKTIESQENRSYDKIEEKAKQDEFFKKDSVEDLMKEVEWD